MPFLSGGGTRGLFEVDEDDIPDGENDKEKEPTPAVIDHITDVVAFGLEDDFDYDNASTTVPRGVA